MEKDEWMNNESEVVDGYREMGEAGKKGKKRSNKWKIAQKKEDGRIDG